MLANLPTTRPSSLITRDVPAHSVVVGAKGSCSRPLNA